MKSRGDLLFEIGCEEIPAGMISKAAQELKEVLTKHLSANGLVGQSTVEGAIESFGAPRRLVVIARGILLKQEDVTKDVIGPPISVAYDEANQPTRAAASFAEKQGVSVQKLAIVSTPRGKYVAAKQLIRGKPATEVLARVLPETIREISWPRSMYWTTSDSPRFIRPVRWIVALLDGKVILFSFGGVRAGNCTRGHRFMGKANVVVTSPSDFEAKLKKNFVLCRPKTRRQKIAAELKSVPARKSLRVHDDAALQEMVCYLNEYPTIILGSFDPAFLSLPREILITVMRGHQKYFAVENRAGEIAPHFLAVINLPKDVSGRVRTGHERVLRARFTDAQFFWESDQRHKLGDYLPRLSGVTYERRLGSYGDKVERVRFLARWISEQWFSGGIAQADVAGSDRTAELAKCDLVTDMVREFPELQGIVGGLYAHAQGEPEEISWAVYDHYRPQGLDDPLPRNLTGCAVAMADKLDSLAACFAADIVPTGSSDPFALRRAALGVVKILLEKNLPFSLSAAISTAARALRMHPPKLDVSPETEASILEFLLERARFVLKERNGFAYDEINAAFKAGADNLGDAAERVAAVRAIRHTKNFPPLAASFKRIRNILEKSAGKGDKGQLAVRRELLCEDAEIQLFHQARSIGEQAALFKKDRKYRAALEKISELRPAVDLFFDKVLVMAEDEEIRRNRIALLGGLLKEFSTIADFSELGGE